MSKMKLVDLNKQVTAKTEDVLGRILTLQADAQQQISVLKRIEAELIKKTREAAEAEKAKALEESRRREEEQRKLLEIAEKEAAQKETPEPKTAAPEMPVDSKDKDKPAPPLAETKPTPKIEEPQKAAEPQSAEKAETAPAVQAEVKEAPAQKAVQTPRGEQEQPKTENKENADSASKPEARDYQRPENRDAGRPDRREQGVRPGQDRPREQRSDSPQSQGDRPFNRDRDMSRPPREGDRGPRPPYEGQRREGQYPPRQDGQYQRPQGQYPPRQDGQYQRPQGQGYPPRQDGQYQRPQGQGYPPRQDGQFQRPQGQFQGGFNKDRFDKGDSNDRTQPRTGARPAGGKKLNLPSDFTPAAEKQKVSNYGTKKPPEKRTDADSKTKVSKKLLVQETRILEAGDEDFVRGSRKLKSRREKAVHVFEPIVIDKAVITSEMVSIKTLADKTGKPASDIIKKLFLLGVVCNINTEISFETAQLVCSDFGIELELRPDKTAEDTLQEEDRKDEETDLITRPPIVTVMGHVDHGKTSLLDAIRKTKVTEQEAGGITQHIGAYSIKLKDKTITFLDTPGHEAFTAMRARGAQVTDIAVLVVAADDGIMPQTVEAINHAKAAKVPIIIAINKIDKPNANIDRIKQELTEHELLAEEWGGETIVVPVSAVTHEGIDQLLEMILLVADVQELKANPNRMAKGTIIEAKLDKGRGPVATVLIQNGTLKISDTIVAGTAYGRVRAMTDEHGRSVKEALPAMPIEVIGFSEVPVAGDVIMAVEQDRLSKQVAEERKDKQKADMLKNIAKVSLDDLFSKIAEGSIKDLNLVVKADVQGSVEALSQALEKLSNEEVNVKIIHSGVGAIQKTDVILASASDAIIIGFNVRPDNMAREAAEKEKIDIRLYRIIYNAIEDIESALKGMLKPKYEEAILGHAQIRTIFKATAIGTIAGSYVTDGKIVRNAKARLLRDNTVVYEGAISTLKRFKDDAKEVMTGYECGITLENYNDIKELDVIEVYEMREIKRQ